MVLASVTSVICAGAFAGLFLFTLARGKKTREGRFVLAASGATALWALLTVFGGTLPGLAPLFETVQALIWLALLETLLRPENQDPKQRLARRAAVFVGCFAGVTVIASDLTHLSADILAGPRIVARAGLAVIGLLLVENLYRNTEEKRLWNVIPLCIGVGGFFAYELFLYSTALLTGEVSRTFTEARPAASLLLAPFLALTLARNRDWRIDHHISRKLVFHTFTLVVSGGFLLAVAVLGAALHQAGDSWDEGAQVISLFGALLVLALVLSSGGIKARLNYLVSRNFFSLRYDYRTEWMRFIDILSANDGNEDLRQRVVRAVANIVDAPRGALWLIDENTGFRPAAFLNMRLPTDTLEAADSVFISDFRDGRWTQVFDGAQSLPAWQEGNDFWLAVPLPHNGRMIGFITLARSRAPLDLNWESFELLRAVGRQAASYICEERAAQALADARSLEEYGKRFAFVGHDIKNLASQLRMLAVNAARHSDNPEFRADAFRTVENAATRMNKLLLQLNEKAPPAPAKRPTVDAARLVTEVASALSNAGITIATDLAANKLPVAMGAEDLRSALTHLISNAIEASPATGTVAVRGSALDKRLTIEVSDQGSGMAAQFIQNELFRPFRTTKSNGTGIGAFQTRELIRAAGGELDVISTPGAGTTMRIVLPLANEGAVSTAA